MDLAIIPPQGNIYAYYIYYIYVSISYQATIHESLE